MSSLSASFEANRQARLPAAAQIKLLPMRDGVLDRTRLDAESPLNAAPSRFQLGLIGGAK